MQNSKGILRSDFAVTIRSHRNILLQIYAGVFFASWDFAAVGDSNSADVAAVSCAEIKKVAHGVRVFRQSKPNAARMASHQANLSRERQEKKGKQAMQ